VSRSSARSDAMSDTPVDATSATRPRRSRWRRIVRAVLIATLVLFALDRIFPPPLPDIARDGATLVVARDGSPLRAFAAPDGVWRMTVSLDDVSPLYLEALLGYEDRWFQWHPGVNPLALVRATGQALWHGEIVSGGSTLTMQVARLIEPGSRSAFGKVRQMLRALQLELRLSKREILTLYVNLAPFGGNIQGVQAASWAYLGKSARQLSHAEAALLAVLPQAPSRLRPDRAADAARAARDKVLRRLADLDTWAPESLQEAQLEPVVARQLRMPLSAALLAERLHRERPDARLIRTSIDPLLQKLAERRVAVHLDGLPARTSAAVLVIDNASLHALAYVGSARFGDDQRLGHVDMVRATRSPGSTLKPFLYGLALDDGLIHSESLLVDAPQAFDGYRPANFGDFFNGPVSAADALRLSLNVPAVELLARVTPTRFTARLRHAGLALELPRGAAPNLSMILGGTGTSLEQLVGAYAALGREGLAGTVAYDTDIEPTRRQLMSPGAAWIVRAILEAHARPGEPISGNAIRLRSRLAWKTGTSFGFRDSWAIGVTPRYTVGVWVGRPDGTPLPGQYGAVTALPLLFKLTDSLPHESSDATAPTMPASVTRATICWPLGEAPDPAQPGLCHETHDAYVLDRVVPPTLPPIENDSAALRVDYLVDARTGLRTTPWCEGAQRETRSVARWPALAQPWLPARWRRAAHLPDYDARCAPAVSPNAGALRIAGIVDATVLRRAPGSLRAPAVNLQALGGDDPVSWLVNGRWVGTSTRAQPLAYAFDSPGEQTIVALDRSGRFDRVQVDVMR
jgi:penicillin-binding protein 1C